MRPGDTVYTPPGEWHWHGAAPTHFMTHLAMWEAPRSRIRGTRDRMGRPRHRRRVPAFPKARQTVTISDAAQRNHDELFPGHVSTLKVTDPELIEVFDNFAFDEVLQYGDLDTRTRLMVQLAAIIACQALDEYRAMLGAALTVGVTPVEVKEIVYQAVPYVGLAKVFDFLHATNEVLVDRGVELPLPRPVGLRRPRRAPRSAWRCRSGSSAPTRSTACTPARPRTRSTSSGTCRPTASATTSPARASTCATRELLTFSMLVALGGADAQVKGHVAGNLNVGNDRADLLAC